MTTLRQIEFLKNLDFFDDGGLNKEVSYYFNVNNSPYGLLKDSKTQKGI